MTGLNMKKVKSKGFYLKLRSRHPSTSRLRLAIKMPVKAVYRHGSTTATDDKYEINSIQSVLNSASKFRMKACFSSAGVKSAEWYKLSADNKRLQQIVYENGTERLIDVTFENVSFPLVAKLNNGSRARGMVKIDSLEHLKMFIQNRYNNQYYFESFYNYNREYRLHVSRNGCFYTCRKLLKNEIPGDKRWFRNDSNCNWIIEANESFDKPTNWDDIVAECVKALDSVGLDVGACDVRVQSSKDKDGRPRKEVNFIVIEINSAPSFGDITLEKYKEALPGILCSKYNLKTI